MFGKWSILSLVSCALGGAMMAECPAPISTPDIEVFPSANRLPENIIRFYLYFPRPMRQDIRSSDIRLLDSKGQEVTQAFLPMRYALWSSDRRRLTIILDPGRVKTGLASYETFGRALTVGDRFDLQVLGAMKDSNGCNLGGDVSFGFSVHAAERQPPAPEAWSIEAPTIGSRTALKVDLGRPHDHLSMAYRIRVATEDGQLVPGRVGLAESERIWTFTPRAPWTAAPHKITIDERLEDLAGNRPGVVFDRATDVPVKEWAREITFVPRPGN